jgi:hypothetical protein
VVRVATINQMPSTSRARLHFALAMAHQTIRDSERLTKLSEGLRDLNHVEGIIERIVAVSVKALPGSEAESKTSAKLVARDAR